MRQSSIFTPKSENETFLGIFNQCEKGSSRVSDVSFFSNFKVKPHAKKSAQIWFCLRLQQEEEGKSFSLLHISQGTSKLFHQRNNIKHVLFGTFMQLTSLIIADIAAPCHTMYYVPSKSEMSFLTQCLKISFYYCEICLYYCEICFCYYEICFYYCEICFCYCEIFGAKIQSL